MPLPLVAPLIGLGKGLLGGLAGLGKKAAVTTAVKSVAKKGKEEVKTKISPSRLPSISPRYYEKPKESNKSTSTTGGGSVSSVKMTAENIKSSLLNQDKSLKTLKSDNAKLEKQELQRQKREQAVQKIKSGLKSIGSKITAPLKGVTGGIGKAIPLLLIGILVNSIGGIIKGVRTYYDKNIKPKVEFVNKKVKEFNDFVSSFSGETEQLEKQKSDVDKKVKELKSVTEDNTVQRDIDKIENALDKGKFNKLSQKEKDEFILDKAKTINSNIEVLDSNTISFKGIDKKIANSELYNSDFFADNTGKEIVYVFQDRIVEMEV
tara:strand:+ start:850 stop:1809 length:960 start_codon:yes stop_codon:yes gene_type:complete